MTGQLYTSDDIATQFTDLARTIRATNVLSLNDYDFLGIVGLPMALECRSGYLCRIINILPDLTRASLYDFLNPLDLQYSATWTTFVNLACQEMCVFLQLRNPSLALIVVTKARRTLFGPNVLDWHHGCSLLLPEEFQ